MKKKRRFLGQHMLVDSQILEEVLEHAGLGGNDVVFEIGTGTGAVTAELCGRAKRVISCEVDPVLARKAGEALGSFDNLILVRGDGFKANHYDFDVFVANLPYSKSRLALEWLAVRDFDRAIIMVQKEFAEKLLARQGSRNYRAVSALAQSCFEIELLMPVGRNSFRPTPKIDSVLLRLMKKKKKNVSRDTIRSLKFLFSFRGKKLRTAMRKLGLEIDLDKRVEHLTPEEALRLAEKVASNERLLQTVR